MVILQIDTTGSITSVALSQKGVTISLEEEEFPNSHAHKITLLIQKVLKSGGLGLKDLNGISLNSGPGSYTGLRIGASVAKGLCLGLDLPLMAFNNLMVMTQGIISRSQIPPSAYEQFCPLLDARRMEVFMALLDWDLKLIRKSSAQILDLPLFQEILEKKTLFFGTGARKLAEFLPPHPNALYSPNFKNSATDLSALSFQAYNEGKFEDIAYYEPHYLKEFYSPAHNAIVHPKDL